MQAISFVLNDPPHGTERSDNALRLAVTLALQPERQVRVFLMADAVLCTECGQMVSAGDDNIETMLTKVAQRGEVAWCGTCMDARGLQDTELMPGCRRSTMAELAQWTGQADKVLVF
ncbi:MAG: DsrE family protein [Betaproteobacteria bacterium]|nr:DsrE family protein [Betaproteobacteria bacterium]MDE2123843.1 DsrE family protein [Betaproteobacteria bacterium]MDE2187967.1 DsrE family protein [Betaproteobacteria bacterium]MDE2325891.1 DsrE family protein [Betaproteobacteria bacterium]